MNCTWEWEDRRRRVLSRDFSCIADRERSTSLQAIYEEGRDKFWFSLSPRPMPRRERHVVEKPRFRMSGPVGGSEDCPPFLPASSCCPLLPSFFDLSSYISFSSRRFSTRGCAPLDFIQTRESIGRFEMPAVAHFLPFFFSFPPCRLFSLISRESCVIIKFRWKRENAANTT